MPDQPSLPSLESAGLPEPTHLPNSVLAAEGIPFVFDHFRFLGYGHDFDESKHPNLPRLHEMPVDDEVISAR